MKYNIEPITYFAKTKKDFTDNSSTSAITGVSLVRTNASLSEELHRFTFLQKNLIAVLV